MTAPANLRLGTVTAMSAGPPPSVTVYLDGDPTATVDALFLDSYAPLVNDTVRVIRGIGKGAHFVLGRAASGAQTAYVQSTSAVGSITTTQVVLLTASPVVSPAGATWRATFGWDTASSTAANARLELRVQRAVDTGGGLGAYTDIARIAPRIIAASTNEGGGTLFGLDPAVAAGSYTYRVTAVRSASDTGTLTVDAGAGRPMTLLVERFA